MDICPGVGLLDHMVVLFLVFQETSLLFFIVASSVYIPTDSVEGFPFLHTSLQQSLFVVFFDDVLSDWCEVIPHCSFDWHFSNSDFRHLFM